MSPLSALIHQLSRLSGFFSGNSSRKTRTRATNFEEGVDSFKESTPSSLPVSPPSPQKISNGPQYNIGGFYPIDQAILRVPSSFSFSPWSFQSPYLGVNLIPEEEPRTTVSYEEIVGAGTRKMASYEEFCRATNDGEILENHNQEQLEQAYGCVRDVGDILSLQTSVLEILLGHRIYEHFTSNSVLLDTELQILRDHRSQLISRRLLLQAVRQVTSRITGHPKSHGINFLHLRLTTTSTGKTGPFGNDELFHRAQRFLQENNFSSLREAARHFVDDPDALANGRLHVAESFSSQAQVS